ncbi:cyclic nucleotide-binding domain-containing protein, partial [Patescibacteria group bacterium]|nr:cyclic nucleotide-binding domain-containing protein [Patescibacteria group bacterium]
MTSFFPYSQQFEDFFIENGEKVEYTKNQHLVWKKDESQWVFFLTKGLVRASFSFPDEMSRIIGYFVPGAIFAQSGSFIAQHDGALSYIAESSTTAIRIHRHDFISAIKS